MPKTETFINNELLAEFFRDSFNIMTEDQYELTDLAYNNPKTRMIHELLVVGKIHVIEEHDKAKKRCYAITGSEVLTVQMLDKLGEKLNMEQWLCLELHPKNGLIIDNEENQLILDEMMPGTKHLLELLLESFGEIEKAKKISPTRMAKEATAYTLEKLKTGNKSASIAHHQKNN